jgi:hypothetical protein
MLRLIIDVNIEEAICKGLLLRQPDLDLVTGKAIQELLVRVLCTEQHEWRDMIEFIP